MHRENLKRLGAIAALVLGLGTPLSSQAAPLNINLADAPDILSQFIDVSYDAGTDEFQANGFSLQFTDDGVNAIEISNGVFSLAVLVQSDGMTVAGTAGDDLMISGDLDLNGDMVLDFSGVLLTAEVSAFGASAGAPGVFELLFSVTGGQLAAPFFGGTGSTVATILNIPAGNSTYTGSFEVDFGSTGSTAAANTAPPVPEPATSLLLVLGIGTALVARGRRQ